MISPIPPNKVDHYGQSVMKDRGEKYNHRPHNGLDIVPIEDSATVYSPVNGRVIRVVNGNESDDESAKRAGLWIDIEDTSDITHLVHRLLHLGVAYVKKDDKVSEGDEVGKVTEKYKELHYEIREWPTKENKLPDGYGPPLDPSFAVSNAIIDVAFKTIPWMIRATNTFENDLIDTVSFTDNQWMKVKKQIDKAKSETNPSKKIVEANAALELANATSKSDTVSKILKDVYHYSKPKTILSGEGLKETANATVQVAKEGAKFVADSAGSLWDSIPSWVKWTGFGIGTVVIYNAIKD